MMTLKRFRVQNFRSVKDSGWIDCQNVTSLVGVNEAGKSNLILALWKLNPVREGEIDLLHDMPRKEFSSWRNEPEEHTFITAEFELPGELCEQIAEKIGSDSDSVSVVRVSRKYDGKYTLKFPALTVEPNGIIEVAESSKKRISENGDDAFPVLSALCSDIVEYMQGKSALLEDDCQKLNAMLVADGLKGKEKTEYSKLKSGILQAINIYDDSSPACGEEVSNLVFFRGLV